VTGVYMTTYAIPSPGAAQFHCEAPTDKRPTYLIEVRDDQRTIPQQMVTLQFHTVADLRRLHQAIGAVLPEAEQS
jgi:hypothetical protein